MGTSYIQWRTKKKTVFLKFFLQPWRFSLAFYRPHFKQPTRSLSKSSTARCPWFSPTSSLPLVQRAVVSWPWKNCDGRRQRRKMKYKMKPTCKETSNRLCALILSRRFCRVKRRIRQKHCWTCCCWHFKSKLCQFKGWKPVRLTKKSCANAFC